MDSDYQNCHLCVKHFHSKINCFGRMLEKLQLVNVYISGGSMLTLHLDSG